MLKSLTFENLQFLRLTLFLGKLKEIPSHLVYFKGKNLKNLKGIFYNFYNNSI